ncbi:acetaldehyde dehydrogenase (acetylating) [Pantoea ananatis]|uniref:acetaldehyde dehydrogenase (acetylating) n=1 Tax=Pantoea ananas TaxID=553 RepID=UPI001908102B|nr:acetaldehyde dehydrogenase (acetylating) [Pantoea ananatis]
MPVRVAILGSGNIGCDLLMKVIRSKHLECSFFIGRNSESDGLKFANKLGVPNDSLGIETIIKNINNIDLIFDATSAQAHLEHAKAVEPYGKPLINLTPAEIGTWCVPNINREAANKSKNVNMITCGGQVSLPIVHAIKANNNRIKYVEVVSSVSAKSAGPATRLNINEYLCTTEKALKFFSGSENVKVILNINPANPPVDMQTTIYTILENPNIYDLRYNVLSIIKNVREYMPGYRLVMEPTILDGKVVTIVKATGAGDYLPPYAGNLDIITSAAVNIAEKKFM